MRNGVDLYAAGNDKQNDVSVKAARYICCCLEHLPDTLGPDVLVQAGVDADIVGSHLTLGKLADLLDSAWGTLLEADVVHTLGQVNGAFAGDNFVDRRLVAFLTLGLCHCYCYSRSCLDRTWHSISSLYANP